MRVRVDQVILTAACTFALVGCATIPAEPAIVGDERDRPIVDEPREEREIVAEVEQQRVRYTVVAPDGRRIRLVARDDEMSILHPQAVEEAVPEIITRMPSADVRPLLPGMGIVHRP
jgi:hypothetical protein